MRNSTIYKLNGAKTFRRSSTKIVYYWGSNLQNIQKEMREIYESDGWNESQTEKLAYWLDTGDASIFTEEELFTIRVFIQRDQSGAEALIVAYDSEARDYRKLFTNNVKPHVYVALKLFSDIWPARAKENNFSITTEVIDELCNTPIEHLRLSPYWKELDSLIKKSDEWKPSERYYYLAKQTVHSSNYGIEASTFRSNVLEKSDGKIVLPMDEAKRFLLTYRSLFPEIPERCKRVEKEVEATRIIYNMFGFPNYITDYNILSSTMKDLYAWGPQSTVGEITRIAITEFQAYVEETRKKWDVLQDNHDSFLTQGPLIDTKERLTFMEKCINQKLKSPIDGVEFNMKSEGQIGFNWGPYKKGKNELGLREVKW